MGEAPREKKNEEKRGFREEDRGETRQRKKSFKRTRMERKIRGKGVFLRVVWKKRKARAGNASPRDIGKTRTGV